MTVDPIKIAILAAIVALFPLGYLKGCTDEKDRFEDFKRLQAALSKAQEDRTLQIIKDGKADKEKTDAENKATRVALAADLERLRKQRPSVVYVPAAPAASKRPELAAFDRAELAAALRALDGDFQAIAGEGAAATIDLNSAKFWARSRVTP